MLELSIVTNKGSRSANEDSLGCFEKGNNRCYIVCDGLGGHGMGDVASGIVVDVFESQFMQSEKMADFLPDAFEAAQSILLSEQAERGAQRKMKTTAAVLVTDGKHAYIGHVGDSRVYVFYKNKVKRRTLDHSIPQMLALSKEIKESEIRHHPERNFVIRVMGVEWEKPMYELLPSEKLKKCQAFLLCTDGFWELIDESEMCALLHESKSVEEWLKKMTETVKKNGEGQKMDNYSAIAVWNTK